VFGLLQIIQPPSPRKAWLNLRTTPYISDTFPLFWIYFWAEVEFKRYCSWMTSHKEEGVINGPNSRFNNIFWYRRRQLTYLDKFWFVLSTNVHKNGQKYSKVRTSLFWRHLQCSPTFVESPPKWAPANSDLSFPCSTDNIKPMIRIAWDPVKTQNSITDIYPQTANHSHS